MLCPHCGQEHPDASSFCTVTGKAIEASTINCPNCGRELPSGIIFCTSCGKVLDNDQTNPADKIKQNEIESFGEISEQEISVEPVAERAFTASTSIEVNTDSMIACPGCGTQQPEGTKFCTFCGAKIGVSERSTIPEKINKPEPVVEIIAPSVTGTIAEAMVACPQCSTQQPEGTKFCTVCGAKIGTSEKSIKPEPAAEIIAPSVTEAFAEPLVVCQECGTQQPEGTKFCTFCGAKISIPEVSSKLEQLVEMPHLLSASDTGANPMIVCSGCGTNLPEGTKFCTLCGTFLPPVSNQPKPAPVAVSSADTVICPNCTNIQLSTTKYCTVCGTLLQSKGNEKEKVTEEISNESLMRCPHCGIALSVGSKFCTSCGMFLTSAQPAKTEASSPFASVDSMGEAQRMVGSGVKDGFLSDPAFGLKARSSEDGQSDLENRICGFCGMTLGMDIQFCPSCGTSLDNTNLSKVQAEPLRRVVPCSFCSLGVPEDALYCPSCGSSMKTGIQPDKLVPEASVIVCKFCSFTQPGENNICVSCGAMITSTNEQVAKVKTQAGKVVKCSTCGEVIPGEMKFCPSCGAATQAKPVVDEKHCLICNEAIPEWMAFCPSCGAATQAKPVVDEKRCAICGEAIPEGMAFCPSCGAATQAKPVVEEKHCAVCGEAIPEGMAFCPSCGAATQAKPVVDEKRCAICGEAIPEGMAFCPSCGAATQAKPVVDEKHCLICDEAIPEGMAFCPSCGAATQVKPVVNETRCLICDEAIPEGMAFCPSCGAATQAKPVVDEKHCLICDEAIPEGMAFCPSCGAATQDKPVVDEKRCLICDEAIPEGMAFCPSCGAATQIKTVVGEKRCLICGEAIPEGMAFCPSCGAKEITDSPGSPVQEKSTPDTKLTENVDAGALEIINATPSNKTESQTCAVCGHAIQEGLSFCLFCGSAISKPALIEIPDANVHQPAAVDLQSDHGSAPAGQHAVPCPNCGKDVPVGLRYCLSCGASMVFIETTIICPQCGVELPENTVFCTFCGTPVSGYSDQDTSLEKKTKEQTVDFPIEESITFQDTPELPLPSQSDEVPPEKEVSKPSFPVTTSCSNCGVETPSDVQFCTSCGASVLLPPESLNLCLHCGNELQRDVKFCVICGHDVDADEDETQIGVSLLKEVPPGENIGLPVIDGDQGEITYDGAQGEVVPLPVAELIETRDSQSIVESPVNSKISCPTCGLLSSIGTSVCASCGTVFNAAVTPSSEVKITAPPVICEYCNLVIPADEDYCTSCGRRLHADLPPRQVNDNMAAKRICRACGLISVIEAETCFSCGASFSDLLVRDVPKPPLKPLRSSADDREGESMQIEQLEKDVQPANKEGAREVSPAPVKRSMKPGLKQKSETTQDLLQRRVKKTPRRSFLIIGVSIAAIFFIAALGLGGKILLDRSGSRISSEDAALTLIATQYKPIATLPAISLTQLPDESLQTGTVEDILPTSTVVRKKTAKPQKTESLSPTAAQENTNADMTQIPVPVIQTSNTLSPNQEVPTRGITPGMTGTVAQDLNSGIKPTPAPMGAVEPQTKVNEVDGATLILIPSGEFLMGSDNRSDPYYAGMEGPPHLVSLKDYWIYRTEVTNAMYKQCVEAKACTPPKGDNLPTSHFPMSMFENHPVVQINWEQAQSYCSWTGGRLPTEGEWEKAARGTDGRRFPWGIDLPGAKYLNYCDSQCTSSNRDQTQDDKYQSTAPVGSFLAGASPYGMLDMAGNVEEWVSDWYAISYKANLSKENPTGPENGIYRVIRGGSWIDKDAARLRVVARIGMPPTTSLDILGFRCVVDKK